MTYVDIMWTLSVHYVDIVCTLCGHCLYIMWTLLGITSPPQVRGPSFVKPDYFEAVNQGELCAVWSLMIELFGTVNHVALLPITFDRYNAIVHLFSNVYVAYS